jgi:Flp pilus assembly protein TadD
LRFLDGAARLRERGSFGAVYPGITREAHHDPAQALAERGWIGAAAWLAALVIATGVARFRPGPLADGPELRRFLAAFASVIVMTTVSLLGFPWRVLPTAVLMLWVLACVAESGAVPEGTGGRAARAYALIRAVALLALLPAAGRFLAAQAAMGLNTELALRAALRMIPGHGDLRFRAGLGLVRAGRFDEARADFESALPGNPDPDVLFNLGWLALQRGDPAEAERRFAEGLRRYPFFKAAAWNDYARALDGLGRTAEARAARDRAAAIRAGGGGR